MRTCTTKTTAVACLGVVVVAASSLMGCRVPPTRSSGRWHENYSYVGTVPSITFRYDHGILAGSYPKGVETVAIEFEDVCAQLGHVCLCGAGGFRIAGKVVEALRQRSAPLERGEFILISGRDHTVSDVVAFVLGCTRRAAPEHNQYFIDDSIAAPRREYHYYVAYPPAKAAVHVVYRKHLLVGHEEMDRLWEIESAFERDPAAVKPTDVERYRRAMVAMVRDVLFDCVTGLITVEPVAYETFQSRLEALRVHAAGRTHNSHEHKALRAFTYWARSDRLRDCVPIHTGCGTLSWPESLGKPDAHASAAHPGHRSRATSIFPEQTEHDGSASWPLQTQ